MANPLDIIGSIGKIAAHAPEAIAIVVGVVGLITGASAKNIYSNLLMRAVPKKYVRDQAAKLKRKITALKRINKDAGEALQQSILDALNEFEDVIDDPDETQGA